MTENKAHLADYQEFKGDSIAFRSSNGRITGKGKIKTGKLDFKDVYYVEELKHYNLFSVSQMCDKKNKVLFTDTGCLVLSPNFKLLDESQVLLKIPRQHNMYSFNLKNIDPSGDLSCLFAKALIDESNKWHRKLENQANKSTSPKEANHSAGTEANDDQDANSEEIDLHGEHFVLPLWSAYSTSEELQKLKRQEKEVNDAAKKEATYENQNANTNSTNPLNIVSTPISTAGPSIALNDDEPLYRNNPSMPHLEDIYASPSEGIFTDSSYDDEGVVTDFNNLDTTMTVSPTFTTRIHTIHPKTQILGDPLSSVQTRSKVHKNSKAHALFQIQKVWILVDLPFVKKAIGTKWVYRNKKDKRGVVVRNKACLVAQGHRQEEGIDYNEVFSLVARIKAIRIFLAFASYMDFIVYQMDVKSAFMYGTINEVVYVTQPPGFVDPKFPNKVYKVVKALYGLHQAPRAWYATLSTFLEKSGYKRGAIDKTLFIKQEKKDIMIVQVYVDDIIFGSTKKSWCDDFDELIKNRFQMSFMGKLTFFLGLRVKQKEEGIFISQDKYVAKILKKFDFLSVKTASTPIKTQNPLVKDEEAVDVDVHLYRFQVTPKTSHLQAVNRIFRYLKVQPKLDLWYPKVSLFDLESYSDSDYAGANLDRKSTTGEAEYVAVAHYYGQVLRIQNQLLDYGFNLMNTKIYIDNESIICIVKNLVFYSKTKHIEIRHHFIRDAYEKKHIQVLKIHIDDNGGYLKLLLPSIGYYCQATINAAKYRLMMPSFSHHTSNGYQFTMSNPHQELASLGANGSCKELASQKQTALGKDESNILIVDSLLKTIWLSMHHVIAMKHCLFQSKRLLASVLVKKINDVVKLQALIDRKKVVVTDDTIRQDLRLDDADGVECLLNKEIITELAHDLSSHTTKYTSHALTQKVFANMRRIGKGFSGVEIPLFDTMLVQPQTATKEEDEEDEVAALEQDKVAQALEILKLERRVKKLEKQRRSKRMHPNRGRIEAIDANKDVTLVDAEVDLGVEDQGRTDDVSAIMEVNAAEPTVFDDEEVTMTMARTLIKMKAKKSRLLDEQMAKRLHDEEVEQAATRERQEQYDFKRAQELQQQKYQSLKRKPISVAQARKNIIVYLKNMAGYKMAHFKGMSEEDVQNMMQIIPMAEFKVEALQVKHDMYMLAEKDYHLSNGVMTLMLSTKLQVEEDGEMTRDLVMKIFIKANQPKSKSLDTSSKLREIHGCGHADRPADISIFIGYSKSSRGFHIYNRQTKRIMETIHVKFDELTYMASECDNLEPGMNCTNFQDSSEDSQPIPSKSDLDNLFGPLYEEYYATSSQEVLDNSVVNTLDNDHTSSSSSIVIEEDEAPQTVSSSAKQVATEPNSPVLNANVIEFVQEDVADFDGNVLYNAPSIMCSRKLSHLQRYHQDERIDFEESFASVARLEAVRIFVHQSPRGIFICQSQYTMDLLKKHRMEKCDTICTPMATTKLDAKLQGTKVDQTKYRSMIGGLMYLTASQPDIAIATFDSEFELIAYLDADLAGCNDDCKIFHMAQQVIPAAQLVPRFHMIGRCNNYAVLQSIPCSPECKIIGKILLDHSLSYALTATTDVPVLLVETSKNLFVAPVNIETIKVFMNKVGYQGAVDKKFLNGLKRIIILSKMYSIEEIQATDDFKEYEMVFMKVDVLMNQPRKRKQSAKESISPHKSLKITIRQQKVVEGNKDDDDFENRLEPGSHKDNPKHVDDNDDKDDEKELTDIVPLPATTTLNTPHSKQRISSKYSNLPEVPDLVSQEFNAQAPKIIDIC
nr:hypothetical protein [Tanacetum cinerariifolium]